jgi:hypothetical protein
MAQVCVCGHDRAAHQHYRAGSDCAICADPACGRFRSPARARWSAFVASLRSAIGSGGRGRRDGDRSGGVGTA